MLAHGLSGITQHLGARDSIWADLFQRVIVGRVGDPSQESRRVPHCLGGNAKERVCPR